MHAEIPLRKISSRRLTESPSFARVRWPAYADHLFQNSIVPLVADLLDAIAPLIRQGSRGATATSPPCHAEAPGTACLLHFELFACDLVVTEHMQAHLMEVNINPAFGTFTKATQSELIRPMFRDLVSLVALPAIGVPARCGGFHCVRRAAEISASAPSPDASLPQRKGAGEEPIGSGVDADVAMSDKCEPTCETGASCGAPDGASLAVDDLSAHMAYMAFKKSHRKRYEKKQGAQSALPLWRTAISTPGME